MDDPGKELKKKNCIIKFVWLKFTPYIQMSGWAVLMITTVAYGADLIKKAEAFNDRIVANERAILAMRNGQEVTNEKLDLVIKLLGGRP